MRKKTTRGGKPPRTADENLEKYARVRAARDEHYLLPDAEMLEPDELDERDYHAERDD